MALSAQERTALIDRYARGPASLKTALAKIPPDALKWRPEPKRWSAHEIIVHCADSESNAHMRLRYLLAEDKPVIQGYDQDRSEEHTSELQSRLHLVCRLLLEKK